MNQCLSVKVLPFNLCGNRSLLSRPTSKVPLKSQAQGTSLFMSTLRQIREVVQIQFKSMGGSDPVAKGSEGAAYTYGSW